MMNRCFYLNLSNQVAFYLLLLWLGKTSSTDSQKRRGEKQVQTSLIRATIKNFIEFKKTKYIMRGYLHFNFFKYFVLIFR